MGQEIIRFGNIEIEKRNFHSVKNPIFLTMWILITN